MAVDGYQYDTLAVSWAKTNPGSSAVDLTGVLHVRLNRPKQLNSMNLAFWDDCRHCFKKASDDNNVRCIVLSGEGRLFSAGLDLTSLPEPSVGDAGRRALHLYHHIKRWQASLTAVADCLKPVITVIHSGCIGAGVDLVSACDIRVCSSDAWFCVKEVAIGLAADVGTLQRFPKIVGNDSIARELAFTARKMGSAEALQLGFVSAVYPTHQDALGAALTIAAQIAAHSPIAVIGTKRNLNYSRDHSVEEGLEYIAAWNAAALQTEDIPIAVEAVMQKKRPHFSKL